MTLEARLESKDLISGPQNFLIAKPRGLCAGVARSLRAFDQALEKYPNQDLYSVGEPAHNTHINNRYKEKGIIFVDSVQKVPAGGKALLGPHGTEVEQIRQAQERGLTVWDTTCPLVTKVEDEIISYTKQGMVTLYWGDRDHQEAKSAISCGDVILIASLDEALSDEVAKQIEGKNGLAFASQTTFNVDEAMTMEDKLREKYLNLVTPKTPDRCYATRHRQAAVIEMIKRGATKIGVLGSPGSSNSKRLFEVALENGADAVFFDSAELLDIEVFSNYETIGFVSGASVEEDKFQEVVDKIRGRYNLEPQEVEVADESKIRFAKVKEVNYQPQFIYTSQTALS